LAELEQLEERGVQFRSLSQGFERPRPTASFCTRWRRRSPPGSATS
jgi:hypothetical protein